MFPIFEQGSGKGIGHGWESFRERFEQIYAQHVEEGRAKAFAFIFYDFNDRDLKRILKDQGVFAKLDRLSGKDLSVFYLHSGERETVQAFNGHFLKALGVSHSATLPCVVFFRVKKDAITDVEVAQLESADLIHGFSELYGAVEDYLKGLPARGAKGTKVITWLVGGAKFIGIEVFRAALKLGLGYAF